MNVTYNWPNGMKSIAGGTRGEIKLSRPWQQEIVVNPETCPFCTGKGHVLEELAGGEWRLLQNRFTPYPFHRMVIPRECWSATDLRSLGEFRRIEDALRLIFRVVKSSGLEKLFITAHIGPLAGQNVCHLHYHIVQYALSDASESAVPEKMRKVFAEKTEFIILEGWGLFAGVGGVKAGQCFVLPGHRSQSLRSEDIALMLHDVVSLYNKRFKSTQGLSPDFSIGLQFWQGEFQYGLYTPVLNHWGAAEQMALYEPGCPLTLPWPHELTAEYLKS